MKVYVFLSSSTTFAILSSMSLRVISFSFAVLLKLFDFVIHTSFPVSSAFCANSSADLTRPSTSVSKRLPFFLSSSSSLTSSFRFSSTPREVFFLFCSSRYDEYFCLAPAADKSRDLLIETARTPPTDCRSALEGSQLSVAY